MTTFLAYDFERSVEEKHLGRRQQFLECPASGEPLAVQELLLRKLDTEPLGLLLWVGTLIRQRLHIR